MKKNLEQIASSQFKKDLKRLLKSGRYKREDIQPVMDMIVQRKKLPEKYVNHKMTGYDYRWDCHIEGDWILLYELDLANNKVYWVRTGKHSDIFG